MSLLCISPQVLVSESQERSVCYLYFNLISQLSQWAFTSRLQPMKVCLWGRMLCSGQRNTQSTCWWGIVSVIQAFDRSWRAANSRLKSLARMAVWDCIWLPERKLSCVGYFHLIRSSFGKKKHIVHISIQKRIFFFLFAQARWCASI